MVMLRASSDAELVWLQRSGDGRSPLRDHDPAPVFRAHLDRIPDETTILNFHRLLEKHELAGGVLQVINGYLGNRGLILRQGTVVDVTPWARAGQ